MTIQQVNIKKKKKSDRDPVYLEEHIWRNITMCDWETTKRKKKRTKKEQLSAEGFFLVGKKDSTCMNLANKSENTTVQEKIIKRTKTEDIKPKKVKESWSEN